MKYTIETHGAGYTETLEFRGKVYKKENSGDASGVCTQDKDFCEQMEADGIDSNILLDNVFDVIDESLLGFDLLRVFEGWEEQDGE